MLPTPTPPLSQPGSYSLCHCLASILLDRLQDTKHPFELQVVFSFFTLQLNTFVHKFPLYTCVIFHIYLLYLLHVYLCTGRPVPAEESHLQIFPLEDRSWWSASGRLCHRWWRAPWETFRKRFTISSTQFTWRDWCHQIVPFQAYPAIYCLLNNFFSVFYKKVTCLDLKPHLSVCPWSSRYTP